MFNRFLILFCSLLIINDNLLSFDTFNKEILSFKPIIDKLYFSFNYKKLEEINSKIQEIDSKSVDDTFFSNYYQGINNYCLGRIYYNYDKEKAFKKFEIALENFKECNKIKKDAEIIAMISATYGKLSSLSILKAIFYGMNAKENIEEAYKLDPNNPKVLIVAATHLMHTPEFYGGDKKKSRELLNKVLSINEYKNDTKINWGNYAEANAYLAQLEILEGNKDNAKKYMKFALEINPNYGFVKYDLEKQLKEK